MSAQSRLVLLVIAAAIVFVTGFVLTRSGRPYSTGLLTVHKLIDLAGLVLIAVVAAAALRSGAGTLDWVLVLAAAVLAVATLATGGIVSATKNAAEWALAAHRLLPWPLLLVLGFCVYRFGSKG